MIISRRHIAGFTLIELLVTVAVMAILASVAFPSFIQTVRSNRVATAANEVLASMSLARSEAIRGTRGSGVCASTAGTACDGNWNDGWMVWTDTNGNASFDTGVDTVVRWSQNNGNIVVNGGSAASFRFDSRGRASAFTGLGGQLAGPQALVVQPSTCTAGYQNVRTATINVTGRVSLARSMCP